MTKSTFGERIIKIRELENVSQAEFCKRTGISLDTLKGIEHKGRDPRGSTLEKIAKSFPKRSEYLLLG